MKPPPSHPSCLFRIDAGEKWGIGHFRRSLSLARVLGDSGYRITFVMAAVPDDLRAAALARGIRVIVYENEVVPGSAQDLSLFRQCSLDERYEWIVFDGYHFDRSYREAAGRSAHRIMVIHDMPGDYCDASVFLDQNVNTVVSDYRFSPECRVLMGPRFSLTVGNAGLRSSRSVEGKTFPRILISLGGADVKRLSLPVARALEGVNAQLDIVLGSASGWRPADFSSIGARAEIHESPDGIDRLVAGADLGIMSLGITTWEMCFYGLPFVMLASNPNQQRVIDWFQKKDLADSGLRGEAFEPDYFRRVVDKLLLGESLRRSRSRRLMQLVDGKGPCRVVQAMEGCR